MRQCVQREAVHNKLHSLDYVFDVVEAFYGHKFREVFRFILSRFIRLAFDHRGENKRGIR